MEVFNYAEVLVIQAMRNEAFNETDVQNYASGLLQSFDNTITTDPNPLGGNTPHTFVSAVTDGVRESDGTTFSNQVTDVTYTPTSGEMVIEINGHGLTAPSQHTASTATYNPNTGFMVVTVANHGFANGDQVKFADNSITFSCGYNGATVLQQKNHILVQEIMQVDVG